MAQIVAPRNQAAAAAIQVRRGRKAVAYRILFALGIGLSLTIALALSDISHATLVLPGCKWIAIGRVTGVVGTYLVLVMVVLVARLAPLERAIGQDRLVRWHRWLAPWPLSLITVHVVAITIGYAAAAKSGAWRELWLLVTGVPNILAAVAGFTLVVLAAVTSWRVARRRLKYETWWAVDLY